MPRISSYHLHLPFYHLDDSKNLRLLYATRVIKDLVNKISFFFLPIFLFELGQKTSLFAAYSLSDIQKGFLAIGLFYFISKCVSFCSAIPIGNYIRVIGFQKALAYSYLIRILTFVALFYVSQFNWLIIIAMITEAIQANLFWNSYHTMISRNTLKSHLGKDLSLQQFFLQIVAVTTPAVAGYFGQTFGFEMLFLFGIVGTLLGFFSILNMDFKQDTCHVSFTEFKLWLSEKSFGKLAIAQSGRYIHDSVLFLWPLYVYLVLGSLERVGFLYTVSLFAVLLVTIFTGLYIDTAKSKKPFYLSGGVLSGLWLLRTQFFSVLGIAMIDAADRLMSNFHWIFFDMIYLRRGKGKKALAYFVYGEMINNISASIFWLLFCIFFFFFQNWNAVFIFGALSVMMTILISDRNTLPLKIKNT